MIQFPQTFADLKDMPDLICFSGNTWENARRQKQIFLRMEQYCRVIFIQKPELSDREKPYLDVTVKSRSLYVIVPHLTESDQKESHQLKALIDTFFEESGISSYLFWHCGSDYYELTKGFNPSLIIYETSGESGGSRAEENLMKEAHLVFTGSNNQFEDYKNRHDNVHNFSDSIDVEHFAQARRHLPAENEKRPVKIGFHGEIDKKLNMKLIGEIADARPEWEIVIAGNISLTTSELCKKANVFYLNQVSYEDLPYIMAGWDAGFLPYAHNEATCFYFPYSGLELISAGKQVISTSIRNIRPFGEMGLIEMADTVEEFILKMEKILSRGKNRAEWILQSHAYLASTSWDQTVKRMITVVVTELNEREQKGNLLPAFSVCLN